MKTHRLKVFLVFSAMGLFFILYNNLNAQAMRLIVNGGNQTMNITTGTSTTQPLSVPNTTCTISYSQRLAGTTTKKVTVSATCPTQEFTLTVLATPPTGGGTAVTPAINLINNMAAADFIRNIPGNNGTTRISYTAGLTYIASATYAQGNSTDFGNDVYTITYTLTTQ